MKLNGKTLHPPKPRLIAIPREDGDIVLTAKAVMSFERFDALCPKPLPRTIVQVGQEPRLDINDPKWKQAFLAWQEKRTAYMVIESLSATEGLEWAQVDVDDPETWHLYVEDLAAVFTEQEAMAIMDGVVIVNAPTEASQKEALERFTLARQESLQSSTSSTGEHDSTKSGEPANDSESSRQA